MTVRGEIYVLTSNWRNCAQRFFLTDSEYTFGSFVAAAFPSSNQPALASLQSRLHTERTAM